MSDAFAHLLGHSALLATVIRAARIVALTDATVLILGESGTGKELLARAIHQHSLRAKQAFIPVNCAALPNTLAESLLFGHRKGAFTGAVDTQQGLLQAADKGTLFLDELGELSLEIQSKLLRFLETGEIQCVGNTQFEQINTRIIAATNQNLAEAVQAGRFRQDLFYRLNIVPLELPPLRQRVDDVELLLNTLTQQMSKKYNTASPNYTKTTIKQLKRYTWPGNVRELRNFCERMVIFHTGEEITPQCLPPEMVNTPTESLLDTPIVFQLPEQGIQLEEVERVFIQQALLKSAGNRSQAARLLGLSRDTLLYRMKKYALDG
ncbi:sigma-54-dependent Fis family transcriptional regulator [Thioflexithrix psekupsensis]|uniref:Sigma-54-dependent Fis family transcriptional regulator n=2 Tax=Thioflexithrix psekupsensis TaxID=1570016 RepID=A0A251X6A3_9GAMM|nr:sigma-54-dependent Fis family transcriptional regulator [Thioflexithrix psekupsensis]